jgi:DNA-binding response OmpR family regulator
MTPSQPRVLVVDDDAQFRKILAHGLTTQGYRIDALDGQGDVVAQVGNAVCDVVLLDLNLPGRNGIDVLKGRARGLGGTGRPLQPHLPRA